VATNSGGAATLRGVAGRGQSQGRAQGQREAATIVCSALTGDTCTTKRGN